MDPRRIPSAIYMLSFVVITTIYDIYAASQPGIKTITQWIGHYGEYHIMLPFVAGIVCGHLFWPRYKKQS